VVTATGPSSIFDLCINDVVATLQMSGSLHPTCYHLTAITDQGTFDAQTDASGTATISQTGGGWYTTGTIVYFEVAKTCGTSVVEAPSYTLSFHL
jgi:hypothetical protein